MSGMLGQTGTRSGILFGDPPAFQVEGDSITSTTVWPPPPLDLKTPTGTTHGGASAVDQFFVGYGIILNASSNYITLGYAGTYHIFLDVRHDVGGSQATSRTQLNYLYVKTGPVAFTAVGDYTYPMNIGDASGTRSQEDGFISTLGSVTKYFPAGTHIWPGGFNRENVQMKCRMFHGIMINV